MTAPNDKNDELLRAMPSDGAESLDLPDEQFTEANAAYPRIEALFDLLRRPATGLAKNTALLTPGQVLGEFEVIRSLASGGMGQVYLARQRSLGRLVALKVCRPDVAGDPRMRARFTTEAVSLAQLNHPNVVPVLSTGEGQGLPYLAMEYVAGPTLAQVIQEVRAAGPDSLASEVASRVLARREGVNAGELWSEQHARLDRAYYLWVIETLRQVAQGLAAVHAAGILHRDVKPCNIVFAFDGVPKIVDFGLARAGATATTTVAGEFYGTPAYTSPEQARGDIASVSPASDVFSFGVMLFECLSLHRPFSGQTAADVLSQVLNSDAPLLRQAEKRIPWELEAIVDKCLRKPPGERYASAQPLADDLRRYLELRPISARPMSKIGRAARLVRRHPWVAAFFLALVAAVALGAFYARSAWSQYRAEQEAESTRHEAELREQFTRKLDEGDAALFRCLTGQRPAWLPAVIEQTRQQALSAYSAALEIDPNAVRPRVQRARLYASKAEELPLALADLDVAQQLEPGFVSIRKLRGYALEALGRAEEAQAAREEAKMHSPTAAADLYWLGVVAQSKEMDFVGAYGYFSQALLLSPTDYWSRLERALFGRPQSEQDSGIRKRVIPELEIAKTMRPDLPFASELLFRFCSDQLDPRDVARRQKELTEQIERFGRDILRAHAMAEILQKQRKYDQAAALLRAILDQDTGGVTAERIGDLEYRRGRYENARDWYRRAITEGVKSPIAFVKLAAALAALKDLPAAEQAYLDGIGKNPKDAFLYGDLGYWYQIRGRLADAEKAYRAGSELPCNTDESPSTLIETASIGHTASCYSSLAALLQRTGRQAEGLQVLERGIARLAKGLNAPSLNHGQIEEQIGRLKRDLGRAYVNSGRPRDALALIDEELKPTPLRPTKALWTVEVLQLLGMGVRALEVARLAEYASQKDEESNSRLSRQVATSVLDRALRGMGLFSELRSRLESRRAWGEELSFTEYEWLGTSAYQGVEAVAILAEGVSKHPSSFSLRSTYMVALAKAGRKKEALKAYEEAKELYVAAVEKAQAPLLPGDGIDSELRAVLVARPWYVFLLQEGKDDEVQQLDKQLRAVCAKTGEDVNSPVLLRAFGEFGSGRYGAAVASLERCLQLRVWNDAVSEGMVTAALAKSLRALGRRQDAIKVYQRAVQLGAVDPGLLSELLLLVVEQDGIGGVRAALPAYDQARGGLDWRVNATLYSYRSWVALTENEEKRALEFLVEASHYVALARQLPAFAGDECLACCTLLEAVSDKLADAKRLAAAREVLKQFPADRVKAMRDVFVVRPRK
jgi:serine/threonine protein kinase/tetratricopeptide (TPR) repeat protein